MTKVVTPDFPVHDLIARRWSPRAFSEKLVPPEILQSLFEAARWSPSSNNEQPWAFLVATKDDPQNYAKLLTTLVEFNQAWAKSAPVLGIAVSHMTFTKNSHPNRNAFYDTGGAVAHLTSEATARGLYVHQMAGFEPQKAKELFAIPADWEPIAAFAIGYLGDPQSLSETLRQRELAPQTRKPISEFVMTGHWGEAAPFAKKSS